MRIKIPLNIIFDFPTNHEECEEKLSKKKSKKVLKVKTIIDEFRLQEIMYNFLN